MLKYKRNKDDCCDNVEHLPEFLAEKVDKNITKVYTYTSYGIAENYAKMSKISRAMKQLKFDR